MPTSRGPFPLGWLAALALCVATVLAPAATTPPADAPAGTPVVMTAR